MPNFPSILHIHHMKLLKPRRRRVWWGEGIFLLFVSCPSLLEHSQIPIDVNKSSHDSSGLLEFQSSNLIPSMHFHESIFARFIFRSSLVLAQQPCYWPDGSGVANTPGVWVNCYSSQASTCCLYGDVCLSNGLCYGSGVDLVRPSHNPSCLESKVD